MQNLSVINTNISDDFNSQLYDDLCRILETKYKFKDARPTDYFEINDNKLDLFRFKFLNFKMKSNCVIFGNFVPPINENSWKFLNVSNNIKHKDFKKFIACVPFLEMGLFENIEYRDSIEFLIRNLTTFQFTDLITVNLPIIIESYINTFRKFNIINIDLLTPIINDLLNQENIEVYWSGNPQNITTSLFFREMKNYSNFILNSSIININVDFKSMVDDLYYTKQERNFYLVSLGMVFQDDINLDFLRKFNKIIISDLFPISPLLKELNNVEIVSYGMEEIALNINKLLTKGEQ